MGDTRTEHDLPLAARHADRAGAPVLGLVGRYRLLGWLASGGMGDVFVGHDPKLERPVAIKRIRADLSAGDPRRNRLIEEARLGAQLSHPNVVQVYDFVSQDDVDHIITEYVEGLSLRELAGAKPMPVGRALEVLVAIVEGLEAAHDAGIVHRDLKTENVLVGEDRVVKITDFGIARAFLREGPPHPGDESGSRSGTYRSMSPEQTLGNDAGERTDLFSLGTLAYELLAGMTPFAAGSAAEIMRNIRERPHRPLIETAPGVPFELSRVVDRLLEKEPALRPASATEVLRALQQIARARAAARVDATPHEGVSRPVAAAYLQAHPGDADRGNAIDTVARLRALALRVAARDRASVVSAFDRELLLCIGYPHSHANNCEAAAHLIRDLLERAAVADVPLVLSGALDVGEVTVLGPESTPYFVGAVLREVVAIGREAAPGTIVASTRVQPRLNDAFTLTARSVARSGGAASLVYEIGERRDSLVEGASVSTLPVFGRDRELSQLRELLATAERGEAAGAAVVVAGPGMGKTRVMRELLGPQPGALQRFVMLARESTRHTAFAPFASLLRRRMPELRGEDGSDPSESSIRAAADRLGLAAPIAETLVVLCEGARRDEPALATDRSVPAMLVDLFASVLGDRPAVFVFEDAHWSDRASLEVLSALVDASHSRAWAVVVTARPHAQLPDSLGSSCLSLELKPLSEEDAARVIAESSRGSELSVEVGRAVVSRAEGVPLALEEITRTVLERGDDPRTRGDIATWVPATLSESVNERLDDLPASTEQVAVLAATVGGEVDVRLLQAAAGFRADELEPHLAALVRQGLLTRGGTGDDRLIAFRHASLRHAVVERVLPAQRAKAHAAIVRGIELALPAWVQVRPEVVAHHLECAGDIHRAIESWKAAGTRLASQWMLASAREHFERAIALAQGAGAREAELDVRRVYSRVLMTVAGWGADEVDVNNARMNDLVAATAQPPSFEDQYGAAILSYVKGDAGRLASHLDGLSAVVSAAPQEARPMLEYLVGQVRGIVHVHTGPPSRARAELERAVELRPLVAPVLRQTSSPEGLIAPRAYLAWCELLAGRVDEALALQREEEADHAHDPVAHAIASAFGITLALGAQRWKAARVRVQRVLDESAREADEPREQRRIGPQIVFTARMGHAVLAMRELAGAPLCSRSDVERLAGEMREAYRGWQRPFMRVATVINLMFLADACLDLASAPEAAPRVRTAASKEARVFLAEGLGLVAEKNPLDAYWASEALRLEARRLRLVGQDVQARRRHDEAREAVERYAQGDRDGAALLRTRIDEGDVDG